MEAYVSVSIASVHKEKCDALLPIASERIGENYTSSYSVGFEKSK